MGILCTKSQPSTPIMLQLKEFHVYFYTYDLYTWLFVFVFKASAHVPVSAQLFGAFGSIGNRLLRGLCEFLQLSSLNYIVCSTYLITVPVRETFQCTRHTVTPCTVHSSLLQGRETCTHPHIRSQSGKSSVSNEPLWMLLYCRRNPVHNTKPLFILLLLWCRACASMGISTTLKQTKKWEHHCHQNNGACTLGLKVFAPCMWQHLDVYEDL